MWLREYRRSYGMILRYLNVMPAVHYFTLFHQLSLVYQESTLGSF
nr:hypothetical protein Iba_chr04bCG3910 [Ipomoea batatas]GMC89804.1 hypothetical protein Iba_chr04fCG2250 [Ipomoea batatas]